jgi:hypothetical protein
VLGGRVDEGIEDHLRRSVEHTFEPQVVAHLSPRCPST